MPSASPVVRAPAFAARLGLRFAGLVLLTILPMALLLLHLVDAARDDQKRAVLDRLLLSARVAASVQASAVEGVAETLMALNRVPRDWAFTPRSCIDRLREVVTLHPQVAGIAVARGDGDVICASLGTGGGAIPASYSHVHDALDRSHPVIGTPVAHHLSDRAVLPIAMRMTVTPPGIDETSRVVVVMLDLAQAVQQLPTSASRHGTESGERLMVFATDGRLLAQRPPPATRSDRGHPFTPALLAAPHGVLELRGDDGAIRLIGFAHAGKAGTIHTVSVPAGSVTRPGDLRVRAVATFAALLSLLGVVLAFRLVRRRVLVPLAILQRFTTLTQGPALDTRSGPKLPGEFQALHSAIREMRLVMATRERILRRATHDLALLADRDALTGIANRRAFDAALADAWAAATVNRESLALAVIDIDAFKTFIDRYGHQWGDDCLRQVADTFRGVALRSRDLAARLGGGKFALLLPATEIDGAVAIAQRALTTLRSRMIRHEDGLDGIVTVSVGVASSRPNSGLKPAALIAAADAALCCAKAAGRGQLVTARDGPDTVAETATRRGDGAGRLLPLYV